MILRHESIQGGVPTQCRLQTRRPQDAAARVRPEIETPPIKDINDSRDKLQSVVF